MRWFAVYHKRGGRGGVVEGWFNKVSRVRAFISFLNRVMARSWTWNSSPPWKYCRATVLRGSEHVQRR